MYDNQGVSVSVVDVVVVVLVFVGVVVVVCFCSSAETGWFSLRLTYLTYVQLTGTQRPCCRGHIGTGTHRYGGTTAFLSGTDRDGDTSVREHIGTGTLQSGDSWVRGHIGLPFGHTSVRGHISLTPVRGTS